MAKKVYVVELAEAEKAALSTLIRRGNESARRLARARILLKAADGWIDEAIAEAVDVSTGTVERTRKRYVTEGLHGALTEHPRPGQQRKLNGKQEAHLIAVACSAAPKGHAGWTLRLLADKVVELGYSNSISPETVRQVLKKTNSSRGKSKHGVFRK